MIGAWMAYTTLVGGCAAAAALALEPLAAARGLPRRVVWGVALAVSLLVPLAVAIRPVGAGGELSNSQLLPSVGGSATVPLPADSSIDWDRWLLALWGVASLGVLACLTTSAVALWRSTARGRSTVLDGARVALTTDTGPGALGFGATRIVLPEALMSLDPARRALLVRHEREHVRAGDPHLLLASLVVLALLPWNPALWYIARRLRVALELDCDARVLASGGDVRAYGELLLTVAATRRPPRLAAYLAFAAAPSPLERRIRAMSNARRSLPPLRQLSLGLAAVAAVVTACETRRPEPVAPVPSFSISNGKAAPAQATSTAASDSAKRQLGTEIRERVPAPALNGDANDPLVIVYDADGNTVLSGRLRARDASGKTILDSIPVPAEQIASVDVIKSGATLPPEARGGLIKVVLKREAGPFKRQAPTGDSRTVLERRAAEPAAAAAAVPTTQLLVIIRDSDGKEIYREQVATADGKGASGALDKLPVDPASIATVDVVKTPADRAAGRGEVRITLKPGQGLTSKR